MKTLSLILLHIFITLIFSSLHNISFCLSQPRYKPTDIIIVDCGASTGANTSDGREWFGDVNSKFTPVEQPNRNSVVGTAVNQGSTDSIPYKTARISRYEFTYSFPVTLGPKFIRLFFYPSSYNSGFTDPKKAFFTVKTGSFTLLHNFSAYAYSLGDNVEVFSKEFIVNVGESQKLDVMFAPFPTKSNDSFVFINGIEVISMPTDLYYTPEKVGTNRTPVYVGLNSEFNVTKDGALEMMYRLNVGGGAISPFDDTGMFRTWTQDSDYRAFKQTAVSPITEIYVLEYKKIPNYTAPDSVYLSAISMGTNTTSNSLNNLTWNFPVDSGFNYMVRLHFCEYRAEDVNRTDRRVFRVYLNHQTGGPFVDVFKMASGLRSPIYMDYAVMVGSNSSKLQGRQDLVLDLQPMKANLTDAILNGVEVFKLNNNNKSLSATNEDKFLLLTPPPPQEPLNDTTKNSKETVILASSIPSFILIVLLLGFLVIWRLKKKKKKMKKKKKNNALSTSSLPEELCLHFALDEIKEATDDFDDKFIIGRGGFGNVYRGVIDIDDHQEAEIKVAIKRLNKMSKQGAVEFKTEIELLSKLRHSHLVSLIGYCFEEGEMILVYEYMENGTLREHLYCATNDPRGLNYLSWKKRLEICIGAASGLNYLHTGGERPIIHRDVKTTNILLDENMVAKVSDFGMSKMAHNKDAVRTEVKGTWGYLDPDYRRHNRVTEKSDVYSFGVVLLEVLCARKPFDQSLEDHEQCNLAYWARKCLARGTVNEIIDPYLETRIAPECFRKYVELVERCLRDQIIQRPSMKDVMESLEFVLELQKEADVRMDEIGPRDEHVYPELTGFVPTSDSFTVPDEDVVGEIEDVSESDDDDSQVGTAFTTTLTRSDQMTGSSNHA